MTASNTRSFVHRGIVAAGLTALVLTGCGDATGPRGTPGEAITFQRLLVADAAAPSARLIALHNDSVVDSYALDAPASIVYRSRGGRFGAINQRTANRVRFIDGGVWTDGAYAHRRNPAMLGFQLQDGVPSYENVNGDWMSVFFDGSGVARWMRESDFIAGAPAIALEVNTGGAHHGGAFAVLSGITPYFAHSVPNAAGAPQGVAVRNGAGSVVAQVAVGDCPGLHGNGSIGSGGVFGCNNGLVLVRASSSGATAEKVTTTGDMAGLALRNAYTAAGGSFILGQFAAFPGQPSQRVLATIDPTSGAIHRLPALPTGVVDHWRAIEPVRGQIVLLGNDGTLFVYAGATRQLQHTIPGVVPALPPSGAQPHQVAVVEGMAAVASPTQGQVVLIDLSTGTVIRRVQVGGAPSRLTILGAQASGRYTEHR
jgi:hypothetical protein